MWWISPDSACACACTRIRDNHFDAKSVVSIQNHFLNFSVMLMQFQSSYEIQLEIATGSCSFICLFTGPGKDSFLPWSWPQTWFWSLCELVFVFDLLHQLLCMIGKMWIVSLFIYAVLSLQLSFAWRISILNLHK